MLRFGSAKYGSSISSTMIGSGAGGGDPGSASEAGTLAGVMRANAVRFDGGAGGGETGGGDDVARPGWSKGRVNAEKGRTIEAADRGETR